MDKQLDIPHSTPPHISCLMTGLLPDTQNAKGLDTFLRAELIKYGELTQVGEEK